MPEEERRIRMRHMRREVKAHNVYRWAADLISEVAEVRVDVDDRSLAVRDYRPAESQV
jgi:trehalose-6-phosphate synthase